MQSFWKEDVCARIAQVRLEVAGPRGKAQFAKQLGISPSTYDYYESTRTPPADVLVRIAEVSGVDIGWLLTGQPDSKGRPSAGHPVIRRAAALMAGKPDAAAPLAAFIDLLAEVQGTFPAAGLAGEFASAADGDDTHEAADVARVPEGAPIAAANEPPPGDEITALAGDVDARRQWVPILGRSAAGVPLFWRADDQTAGLTTLTELIARHADQPRQHVQPATLHDGAAQQPAQVITLRTVGIDEVPEYVKAGTIKADYPDAFAVRIDGNSMSPDIAHGDVVILSPSAPAIDGRAAVVQLIDQIGVTCKLYRRDGQTVHLVPINEELMAMSVPAGDVVWALRVLARVRADIAPIGR